MTNNELFELGKISRIISLVLDKMFNSQENLYIIREY